jgi:flagellar hook assembly protein FlgD
VVDFTTVDESNLVRNYPNPFNGTTNIELKLKKSAYVTIEVINISGAIVSQIQNGDLYEGTHRFKFDASNLPSGLYFGKVRIGNEMQTLKMIAR